MSGCPCRMHPVCLREASSSRGEEPQTGQHYVERRRGVPLRQDEPVPVGPGGVLRIYVEPVVIEGHQYLRRGERAAQVAALRAVNHLQHVYADLLRQLCQLVRAFYLLKDQCRRHLQALAYIAAMSSFDRLRGLFRSRRCCLAAPSTSAGSSPLSMPTSSRVRGTPTSSMMDSIPRRNLRAASPKRQPVHVLAHSLRQPRELLHIRRDVPLHHVREHQSVRHPRAGCGTCRPRGRPARAPRWCRHWLWPRPQR